MVIIVKIKNSVICLLIRNLLYRFCKLYNLKLKIIYNEQTRIMTFKIEDKKNEN